MLVSIHKDDVLRGLKKFRRLAKQDLLASGHTSKPAYWRAQAEARRRIYGELIDSVTQRGVDAACEEAIQAYAALPLFRDEDQDPVTHGAEQAYELFFRLIGMEEKELVRLRNGRRRRLMPAGEGRASQRTEGAVVEAGV